MKRSILVLAALALLLGGVGHAKAGTITIGSFTSGDTTFASVDRLQQVYSASYFSGSVNISEVSFFAYGSTWNGTSTWQMSLSTSQNSVGTLSTTFSNNVGANNAVFATETFTGTPSAGSLVSFFGSFTYDPSMGDLLVDVQRVAGPANGAYLESGYSPGSLDRAYSFNSVTTADAANEGGYGIRTQFQTGPTSAATPEPATITLLGIGIAGMAGYGWRRRKRAAA